MDTNSLYPYQETIKTGSGKSSMESIRLTKEEDGTTILTFIGDTSHGHRTFHLSDRDMKKLLEISQEAEQQTFDPLVKPISE